MIGGSYREIDTDGVFAKGDYIIENKYFSPTFNWYEKEYIDTTVGHSLLRTPLVPIYHTEYTNLDYVRTIKRADKNFGIGARVLITLPSSSGVIAYKSSVTDVQTGYSYNTQADLSSSNAFNYYFCRGNFIHFDNQQSGTAGEPLTTISAGTHNGVEVFLDPNLSFNDVIYDHVDPTYDIVNGLHRLRGLHNNFYRKMLSQLKAKPRLKVLYLNLTSVDVNNLDFQKLVFIDGLYYRINKVIDYKPHLKQSTKVELTEYFNLGGGDNQGDVMTINGEINL